MANWIFALVGALALWLVDSTTLGALEPEQQHDGDTPTTPEELLRLLASDRDHIAAAFDRRLKDGTHFVTEICIHQSLHMLRNLGERWAMQMLDSNGKPGSGFFYGNVQWAGSFDECVSSQSNWNSSLAASQLVTGKYCTASIPINVTSAGVVLTLAVGLCVPSGCSANDTTAFLQLVFQLAHLDRLHVSTVCQDQHRLLDAPAIAATCVCAAFAVLLLAATAYDLATRAAVDPMASRPVGAVGEEDTASCPASALRQSVQAATSAAGGGGEDERTALLCARAMRTYSASVDGESAMPVMSGEHTRAGSVCSKMLLCFSAYSNATALLRTSGQIGTSRPVHAKAAQSGRKLPRLNFLDGIRFLTLCWVIVGHVYTYSLTTAVDSAFYVLTNRLARWPSQGIINATFSTDTFFFLSGLLVSYILLNEMHSRDGGLGPSRWLHIYVHRYLRLTPAYAAVLMIWSCLAVYFSDGPFWPRTKQFDSTCASNWWTNLVYVNNFWGMDEQCLNWSWYLANDMQFFLIAPPLVWLTYRRRSIGVCLLSLLVVASSVASVVVTVNKHLFIDVLGVPLQGISSQEAASEAYLRFFRDYYAKPWCRFQAYGAGMLHAVLLRWYAQRDSTQLPQRYLCLGWLGAVGCWLSVVYAPYDVEIGNRSIGVAEAALYNGFARLAWCFVVGWLVWACYAGRAGWIARFLSWAPFAPLSRLTYCTYLIHPIVIMMAAAASRTPVSLDDLNVASTFVGTLGLSIAAAFVCSVTFEMPLASLERLLASKTEP